MLQVYLGDGSNAVMASLDGANFNTNGWVMKDWIADGTDPGGLNNFSNVNLLVKELDSYAEDKKYIETINSIIKVNKLYKFDKYNYTTNKS